MATSPLRIVTFNFLPIAYDLVVQWIHENGHNHILAVTTPGPKSRPTPAYKGIVENAPREVDILVTTRLRTVATPLIRALEPDLIVCFSFPYRITPELCAIPHLGAVNLHPALLPAYRGPNVFRVFYDGAPEFGATAHWMAEAFDTGNILSQKSALLPQEVTQDSIFPLWTATISEALSEGLAKAIVGDPGVPQDDKQATYAAPFTEEETWLDLSEPQHVIQRKEMALNFGDAGNAKVMVEKRPFAVMGLELLLQQNSDAIPGQVIEKDGSNIIVQTGDGSIRLQVKPLRAT
jgi:methionyl-tRNA formyltransferase